VGSRKRYQDRSDEELMQQVVAGNRAGLEHLYDRYFDKLVWFACRFVGDTQSAEDAVQEVFIKVIEKPLLFDTQKKFSAWIYTVTANHCRNKTRDHQNRERILRENMKPPVITGINDSIDLHLLQQRLQMAFSGLSDKEQRLYTLRFEEELSIKQIAEQIVVPEGTVKSGIFNLLKKISKQIKEFTYAI
jgi:RNA polymerase sigma-70 factor, ECF subfamily